MQTQDPSADILFKLWPWLEANKTRLIGGAAAIVVLVGVYSFISWQRQAKEMAAGQALTQLISMPAANTSPSQLSTALTQLAVKYSGTAAAQRAQLQAAAVLFEAGNYPEAQAQFQKFLDATPSGQFAATAILGVAASLEAQNKLDLATAAYQKVTASFAGSPAELQADFALGRLAEQAGKLAEAANFYENAARAGRAGGSVAEEAFGRANEIRAKLAATPKISTPASTPAPTTTNLIPVLKK
ncbi:MAG TPA: tetratricopeptide repeat protein [Verrucomicrobiae bacterium]|jgi:predicted negative regulator of RcsB-dependent stress response